MPRKPKPLHYRGGYLLAARRVREQANRNPAQTCWRCGQTLAEVRATRNPRAIWTAGHVNDGEVNGLLLPECSPCNYGAGADLRNGRRGPLAW